MKSPALALHEAQILRIESQTNWKVFDDFPENEAYPYITAGESSAGDWSDKFEPGQEIHSTTHFWSQYHGRKEIKEMYDSVLQALTTLTLDLGSGFRISLDAFDSWNVIIDMDGKTRHGILKLRYLIEEL